jgi:hypothetical protein
MSLELFFQDLAGQQCSRYRCLVTYNSIRSSKEISLIEPIFQSSLPGKIQDILEILLGVPVLLFQFQSPRIEISTRWCDSNIICLEIWCCSSDRSEK